MNNFHLIHFLFEEFYHSEQEIKGSKLQKLFNYFHLSRQYLGNQFTFTPRIPRSPMQFEDNFTPRVSLGKTIKNCQKALEDLQEIGTYVYVGDKKKDPSDDFLTVSIKKETESNELYGFVKKKKSDSYFDAKSWLKYRWSSLTPEEKAYIFQEWGKKDAPKPTPIWWGKPIKVEEGFISGFEYADLADFPEFIQKKFKFFVPDAPKTNEYWSLEPVTMYLVGQTTNENSDVVRLTIFGASLLNDEEEEGDSTKKKL